MTVRQTIIFCAHSNGWGKGLLSELLEGELLSAEDEVIRQTVSDHISKISCCYVEFHHRLY